MYTQDEIKIALQFCPEFESYPWEKVELFITEEMQVRINEEVYPPKHKMPRTIMFRKNHTLKKWEVDWYPIPSLETIRWNAIGKALYKGLHKRKNGF